MEKRKPNNIQVLSLDLDGTILKRNFDYCLWGEGGYEGILWGFVGRHLGITPREAYEQAVRLIPEVPNSTISIRSWIDYYKLPFTEKQIVESVEEKNKLYEDYKASTEELRERFPRIILSTENSGYLLDRKLEETGIRENFDAIYSSVDMIGREKNEEFFRHILEKEGVGANKVVHVGDSYSKDYVLPRRLGILAYFISANRTPDPRVPTRHQLTSLKDLLGESKTW